MCKRDSPEQEQQFYDDRWRKFRFANRLKLIRCKAILDSIASRRFSEPPRMVDLGCGAGWMTAILGNFGPTLGVDLSGESIRLASARYTHVEFEQIDFRDWDPPGNSFDVVVSQEVVEHVEDQRAYIGTANSLLCNGGVLILTTPNATTFNTIPTIQRENWSSQPIEKLLTVREMRSLVSECDFRVVRMTTLIGGCGSGGVRRVINSTRLRRLLGRGLAGRLYEELLLEAGFGLHTLIVAEKTAVTSQGH